MVLYNTMTRYISFHDHFTEKALHPKVALCLGKTERLYLLETVYNLNTDTD